MLKVRAIQVNGQEPENIPILWIKYLQGKDTMITLQKGKSLLWLPVISWGLLYVWIFVVTQFSLVPWDTSINPPPIDTWQGKYNTFFDAWPGSHLPSIIVVSLSVITFLIRLTNQHEDNHIGLIARFSFTNFGFIILSLPAIFFTTFLRDVLIGLAYVEAEVGYYKTWPYILVNTMMIIILLLVQFQNFPKGFLKKMATGNC